MKQIFILAFLLWGTSGFTAQLAVTREHSCLLSETQLKCWDGLGTEMNLPMFQSPRAITATAEYFCAIDGKRIRCWAYGSQLAEAAAAQFALRDLASPRIISGGDRNGICVWDSEKGLRCHGENLQTPPAAKWVTEIAVGQQFACAISGEGGVFCWGKAIQRGSAGISECPNLLKYPTTRRPRSLAIRDLGPGYQRNLACAICLLDDNDPVCWGHFWNGPPKFPAFQWPRQLRLAYDAIWNDEGTITAMLDDSKPKRLPEMLSEIRNVVLMTNKGDRVCAANEAEIACSSFPVGFPHGMKISAEELEPLKTFLEVSAPKLYKEKRALLETAIELMNTLPDREKLFVFLAVEPLLESVESEIVEQEVLPRYRALRAWGTKRIGVSDLSGFYRREATLLASLRLLHAAAGEWPGFQSALGLAIVSKATNKALGEVALAAVSLSKEIDALISRPRTTGIGVMLKSLLLYVRVP